MIENKVIILSADIIKKANISPADCIQWVEESFKMKYEAELPAKLSIHPQGQDFFNSMPALLPARFGRFGIKVVSRIEGQTPALKSDILLYDSHTGQLLAIADGDWVTAMRTGAVTALTVKTFASTSETTYSLMGLGNTACSSALCLTAMANGQPVHFRLLRYKDQAERFIARFANYPNVSFEVIDQIDDLVSGASVLISCVTSSPTNVLCPNDELFHKGILVIPVHSRGFQNCDLSFDKVYGDDTGQVCGFKYFDRFRSYEEFSKVLLGESPGRETADERILCYNTGLGLHDVLFVSKLYDILGNNSCESYIQKRENKDFWV